MSARPPRPAPIAKLSPSAPSKIDKTGLYDIAQVKRVLDDHIIAFLDSSGYSESTIVSNIKILFGSLSVAAAIFSHFGPGEFPDTRPTIIACLAVYFACMGIIAAASGICDGDAIFVGARAGEKLWAASSATGGGGSGFRVEFRPCVRKDKARSAVLEKGYERWFSEDGEIMVKALRKDLNALLKKVGKADGKTGGKTDGNKTQ